jgi:tRNA(Ile)-lysidine synthetase-like protein
MSPKKLMGSPAKALSPNAGQQTTRRPIPGPQGGKLIRLLIQHLEALGLKERFNENFKILLAVSGGIDSVAMAGLVLKYLRPRTPRWEYELISLDHGWREDTHLDRELLTQLSKQWGVHLTWKRLVAASPQKVKTQSQTGRDTPSPEQAARSARYDALFEEAAKSGAGRTRIWVANHGDDLAETVLWRILTGAFPQQPAGILLDWKGVQRPLLCARKADLQKFLEEERLTHREDSTNSDLRLLRNRMRASLFPRLVEFFPRSVEHLMDLGLRAQDLSFEKGRLRREVSAAPRMAPSQASFDTPAFEVASSLAIPIPLAVRREIHRLKLGSGETEKKGWDLPQGWRLQYSKKRIRSDYGQSSQEPHNLKDRRRSSENEDSLVTWSLERVQRQTSKPQEIEKSALRRTHRKQEEE